MSDRSCIIEIDEEEDAVEDGKQGGGYEWTNWTPHHRVAARGSPTAVTDNPASTPSRRLGVEMVVLTTGER